MGKYILIGAIIGGLFSWLMNFSIYAGLLIGLIMGGIIYTLIARRTASSAPIEKTGAPTQSMQLKEEQLDIRKERVKTGEVNIRTEVVEDKKTITVPIKRQEMVIEAGSEEELRIPLKEEEIKIMKQPTKVADVSIYKRNKEEIQQVKETIKKETAHIKEAGEVDVKEARGIIKKHN